jgi:hypothetical protein
MKTRNVAVAARVSIGVSAILGTLCAAGYLASWFLPMRFTGPWVIVFCLIFPLLIVNIMIRRHFKIPRTSDVSPQRLARISACVFILFVVHFFWLFLATEGGRIDHRAIVPRLYTGKSQSRALTPDEYQFLRSVEFRFFATFALCVFLWFGSEAVGVLSLIPGADQKHCSDR